MPLKQSYIVTLSYRLRAYPNPPSSPTILFTWVTAVILKPHWSHETVSKLRQLNVCATVWIITAPTRERTRQAIYVFCNIEAGSRNHCCSTEAISITYFECVFVALVIRHAERMRRMISSSVAYPTVQYFPHYLTNGTIFWKKVIHLKMCVFIFRTTFVRNVPHSKKNLARYYHNFTLVYMLSTRYSCEISMNLNIFMDRFFEKKIKYGISWKSVQWERSCSMRAGRQADGRSDMKKLRFAFHSFANTPKKKSVLARPFLWSDSGEAVVVSLVFWQTVVLSGLQQGVWGPFCKQGENDR